MELGEGVAMASLRHHLERHCHHRQAHSKGHKRVIITD
jgi:hypothetical protein